MENEKISPALQDCEQTILDNETIVYTRDGKVIAKYVKAMYTKTWYNIDDKLHRIDGPARIYDDGYRTTKYWYHDGKKHRDDGPAVIHYKRGQIIKECWYHDGKKHRDNEPAVTQYENSHITGEYWYCEGQYHRVDGPAVICYKNGQITGEAWYRNGKLCSIGVLASVVYRSADLIEYYYTDDRMTRDIDEFRDAIRGDAIHGALRALPIPIRDAIIPHYCYQ